ncbi:UNVERIFIED_CONTAM: Eukaryotic translation initiation factor 2-alpha kinase [Trichonephila clavipes]
MQVWENGTRIWLVPSLDGLLFKYDKLKLEPLPFNAESLLSHSVVLDQSTSVTGGKFKIVYGFHRHTGENIHIYLRIYFIFLFKIYYKCSLDGCENFKPISAKDGLIIEQWVQSVNAVDTETAELSLLDSECAWRSTAVKGGQHNDLHDFYLVLLIDLSMVIAVNGVAGCRRD